MKQITLDLEYKSNESSKASAASMTIDRMWSPDHDIREGVEEMRLKGSGWFRFSSVLGYPETSRTRSLFIKRCDELL